MTELTRDQAQEFYRKYISCYTMSNPPCVLAEGLDIEVDSLTKDIDNTISFVKKYNHFLTEDQIVYFIRVFGHVGEIFKHISSERRTPRIWVESALSSPSIRIPNDLIQLAFKYLVEQLKDEEFRRTYLINYTYLIDRYLNTNLGQAINVIMYEYGFQHPLVYDSLFNGVELDTHVQNILNHAITFEQAKSLGFNIYYPNLNKILDVI